jgi:hypothetical protein
MFPVSKGRIVGGGPGTTEEALRLDGYRLKPPTVVATKFPLGGAGVWWRFGTAGEHTIYRLDEQTGYIATVVTVKVFKSQATKFVRVEALGLLDKMENGTSVVYFSAPTAVRVNIYPLLHENIDGAQLHFDQGIMVDVLRFDLANARRSQAGANA